MHRPVYVFCYVALCAAALSACGGNSSTPPTFVVQGLGAAGSTGVVTLDAATTYTLTATETASGGGSVTPGPLTITFDSAAIGTATGDTIVTGTGNATGHIKVVDSTTGRSETFSVVVLSTHPATVGDTLTLAGTMTHTITRPLPAPSAIAAPVTTTATVSDVVKITSLAATFGKTTGLTDYNVVETDTAPLQTIGTTSDSFDRFVPSGTLQDFVSAGFKSTDTNGVTDVTAYGTGAGIIDELPDTSGATFTNTAALDFSEAEPDSTTIARTVAADGTYTEADNYLGNYTATTVTSADLSGSITNLEGFDGVDLTYAAPAGGVIAYDLKLPGEPDVTGTVATWFPTATIYSDTSVKATAQAIPAACAVPSSVGTTATQIVETIKHLDTALGTFETRVQAAYNVPGYGTVCAQLSDDFAAYYDYTGQAAGVLQGLNFAVSPTPIQIDKISETVGFTTGTVSGSSVARRATESASLRETLRAVTPIFDRAVQSVYRARRDATMHDTPGRRARFAKVYAR